tara:strand:+ start:573 stop:689 length:117 start_codon:yes stop_codon:yes gene_type:complete
MNKETKKIVKQLKCLPKVKTSPGFMKRLMAKIDEYVKD